MVGMTLNMEAQELILHREEEDTHTQDGHFLKFTNDMYKMGKRRNKLLLGRHS